MSSMTILDENSELKKLKTELEAAATLKSMVLICLKIGMIIAILIIEENLNKRAKNMTDSPVCPKCGKKLESKGFLSRQLTTLIGRIHWMRRVWRCPDRCKIGQIAPFDDELGLRPNQRTGDEIKEMACCLAVFLPFNIAALLFKNLTGTEVCANAIWNWVQWAGAMAKLEKELEELKDKLPDVEETDAEIAKLPLMIGGDGVMVPFRPDGGQPKGKTAWKEVKIGIFARLGKRITKKGKEVSVLVRKRVVAVLGDVDDYKPRMWLRSLKEGILEAETVIWLSDGGKGFWRVFYDLSDGRAQGILDFYHGAQYLWKAAKSWLDGRTEKARKWFASARKRLRIGRGQGVINEINQVLKSKGDDLEDTVRNTLENLVEYLTRHKDHIKYNRYKELGLPIGSGMVESTCKWLIQQRFKGVGMRWSENGFNNLLHLRLAWMNETYADLFESIGSPK